MYEESMKIKLIRDALGAEDSSGCRTKLYTAGTVIEGVDAFSKMLIDAFLESKSAVIFQDDQVQEVKRRGRPKKIVDATSDED